VNRFRHIFCLAWLATVLSGEAQAERSSGNNEAPDTVRIRMIRAKLSQLLYINQEKEYYLQLEQLARRTEDEALLADCCYELSYIFLQQSDYPAAIEYVTRALRYFEAHDDKDGRANCYRIMGTLYLLLSPEQADAYYRRSFELSSREDSLHAVISKCMMSTQPGAKNDRVFNEIRRINPKLLSASQQAAVDYLYAVMAREEGDLETALAYALKTEAFFSTVPQLGYMHALNQHELATLYFSRGDLPKAKQALSLSDSICKRDDYRLTAIRNLRLLSEIFYAEGYEMESLRTFKEYSNQLDSLLGSNQVRSLTGLLMWNLLNENAQERLSTNHREHQAFYLLSALIMLLGIATLYYFRDSLRMRRKKYLLLSQLAEQTQQLSSNPELKQHLSIIMFEYKKGLDYFMDQLRHHGGKPEDYQKLNRNMDEASDFIDQLKKWMDEQPYCPGEPSRFEARKITDALVRMLEIIFYSKRITVQNNMEDVCVFGNRVYFSIAFEIMLFRLMQKSEPKAGMILSTRDNGDDFVTFTLASPRHVLSDEVRDALLTLIRKLQANPKAAMPLQNNDEICLKCIYENDGTLWFESSPEKGTVLNFTIPKNPVTGQGRRP
jgi:tetratricopeptide (TPR) repeat protein